MLKHENIWVCVKCRNGVEEEELQEYEVNVGNSSLNGKIIRCWIPSSSDQTFSIHYGHKGSDISFRWVLFIDGIKVHKNVTLIKNSPSEKKFPGFVNASNTVLPFKFSQTQFASEEEAISSTQDIGSIEIQVFRVISTKVARKKRKKRSKGLEALKAQKTSEKGKVLAPHRISLGDEIVVPRMKCSRYTTSPYDPLNPGPYIIFRFQYRPKGTGHIISLPAPSVEPRQDSKDAIDIKDDPDNSGIEDEIEEIERRLQRLRERQSRQGSRTRQASQAPYAKTVKREPGPSSSGSMHRPFTQRHHNEIIDLTSD